MAYVSVSEASRLVGISRATMYRKLKEGAVSRVNDGKIDTSELVRVFGELKGKSVLSGVVNEAPPIQDEKLLEQLEQERKTVKELREKLEKEREDAKEERYRLLNIIENRLTRDVSQNTGVFSKISNSFSKLFR